MKTYLPQESKTQNIDAKNQVLGRLATKIAVILRGKDKPEFAPHKIVGDKVIVTNADDIRVTGNKLDNKIYYRHTGYIGGLKQISLKDQLAKDSTEVIKKAVYGMLPSNRLRSELMKRLTVYPGDVVKEDK
ncbi:50S ribosomal protein L13 [Candidatus Berkelbacteria bacterium]|nr:50S ribosomal protein L13 [Candidatus Berkelbacteria bacterium]